MMPTLSSLAAPEVVVTTTSGAASDDKVGIMTTHSCLIIFTVDFPQIMLNRNEIQELVANGHLNLAVSIPGQL